MAENNHLYAGVDLGGTSIKAALINGNGEILYKSEESLNHKDVDSVLQQMKRIVTSLVEKADVMVSKLGGIGVGLPGQVDVEKGYIHLLPNFGWVNFQIRERLENIFGIPVFIENDANVAALGEMWTGAGAGSKHILMVTLGTGVGGGLILNRELIRGASHMAGEIGHISIIPNGGELCICGKYGCLETVSSGTALLRETNRAVSLNGESRVPRLKENPYTIKDIIQLAKEGDPMVSEIVKIAASYLGFALANLSTLINPELIIIGGGVSQAGPVLLEPIRESFRQYSLRTIADVAKIVPAQLENNSGTVGSAYLARNHSFS